ncbi:MAG TPA: hypothetical protein VFT64_05325 [Rickettsiales bacterium]|nr:hypothetical protein [Rickettsiales bacterium]
MAISVMNRSLYNDYDPGYGDAYRSSRRYRDSEYFNTDPGAYSDYYDREYGRSPYSARNNSYYRGYNNVPSYGSYDDYDYPSYGRSSRNSNMRGYNRYGRNQGYGSDYGYGYDYDYELEPYRSDAQGNNYYTGGYYNGYPYYSGSYAPSASSFYQRGNRFDNRSSARYAGEYGYDNRDRDYDRSYDGDYGYRNRSRNYNSYW